MKNRLFQWKFRLDKVIKNVNFDAVFFACFSSVFSRWIFRLGYPSPIVIWRSSDGTILDASYEKLNGNVTRNGLVLPRIDRSHLLQAFTCEAFPPVLGAYVAPSLENSSLMPTLSTVISSVSSSHSPINGDGQSYSSSLGVLEQSPSSGRHQKHPSLSKSKLARYVRRVSVMLDLNCKYCKRFFEKTGSIKLNVL